jgi:large subunit ribosomal protein L32e
MVNIKGRKLKFTRQEYGQIKRLKKVWRKPKGIQSKLRLNKKNHERKPSQGYRSSEESKRNNLIKLVNNFKDLENVKKVIIASKIGMRKKIDIVKKAEEKKIEIVNIPDIPKFIKSCEEQMSARKDAKKKKKAAKKKSREELEKKEVKKEEKPKEDEKKPFNDDLKSKPKIQEGAKMAKQPIQRASAPKQK